MKKIGRKTKLNRQLQRRICALLSQGHTIATVSAMVSIGERTFYEWCEKHPQFSQATTCAIGKSKIALVNKLRRSDDWRASAFLLERRFPSEFGRVAERDLPQAESGEKRLNVAFVITEPDGRARRISEERRERLHSYRQRIKLATNPTLRAHHSTATTPQSRTARPLELCKPVFSNPICAARQPSRPKRNRAEKLLCRHQGYPLRWG
jgi:hypothetical protein